MPEEVLGTKWEQIALHCFIFLHTVSGKVDYTMALTEFSLFIQTDSCFCRLLSGNPALTGSVLASKKFIVLTFSVENNSNGTQNQKVNITL